MEENKSDGDEAAESNEATGQANSVSQPNGQGFSDKGTSTYASALRAIGNDLEALQVEVFEMERQDDGFLVRIEKRGSQTGKPATILSLKSLQSAWRRMVEPPSAETGGDSEIRYSAEDIDALDRRAREKRNQSLGLADTYRLSQVLRVVGAYVDLKGARLLRVSVREGRVTLQYETAGVKRVEEHRVASLYDFAVNMYLRRADRKS